MWYSMNIKDNQKLATSAQCSGHQGHVAGQRSNQVRDKVIVCLGIGSNYKIIAAIFYHNLSKVNTDVQEYGILILYEY